jgi:hypothetical protein
VKSITFQVSDAEEKMLKRIMREFERRTGTGRKCKRSEALRMLIVQKDFEIQGAQQ